MALSIQFQKGLALEASSALINKINDSSQKAWANSLTVTTPLWPAATGVAPCVTGVANGVPLDINLGTVWAGALTPAISTVSTCTTPATDLVSVYAPVAPLTPIDTYKQMVEDLEKQIADLLTVNSRLVEASNLPADCPVQPVPPAVQAVSVKEPFPLRALQHRKQQVGLLVPFGD